MLARLAETKVDYTATRRSFPQIVDDLRGRLPYPIEVHGTPRDGGREHNLGFAGLSGENVVAGLERLSGLAAWYTPGTIHLSPEAEVPEPEGPEAVPAGLAAAKALLRAGGRIRPPVGSLLPVDFDETPFRTVIQTLTVRLRARIEVTEDVAPDLKISLVSDRMTASRVLDEVAAAAGLSWALGDDRILITDPYRAAEIRSRREAEQALAGSPVDLRFRDVPLHEAIARLSRAIGVPVYVDRALWEPDHPRVTVDVPPRELRRWLTAFTGPLKARAVIRHDAVYIVPASGK